jgi:hypothetical protein
MNEVSCAAHVRDCGVGVERWSPLIGAAGYEFRLVLPSSRLHRAIGVRAGTRTDPEGRGIGGKTALELNH